MKYDTVIYCFYSAKKGIDFGKSLFVLEGIKENPTNSSLMLNKSKKNLTTLEI